MIASNPDFNDSSHHGHNNHHSVGHHHSTHEASLSLMEGDQVCTRHKGVLSRNALLHYAETVDANTHKVNVLQLMQLVIIVTKRDILPENAVLDRHSQDKVDFSGTSLPLTKVDALSDHKNVYTCQMVLKTIFLSLYMDVSSAHSLTQERHAHVFLKHY